MIRFDDRGIVALSGAHAVGRCHTDRSGFWGPWTHAESTMSNEYFRLLFEEKWTPKKTLWWWAPPPPRGRISSTRWEFVINQHFYSPQQQLKQVGLLSGRWAVEAAVREGH